MSYGNETPQKFAIETRAASGADQYAALTIRQRNNQQIVLRRIAGTALHANADIDVMIAKRKYKTTLKTATVADATTGVVLNGDDDGFIAGHQITSNDFLLIATENEVNDQGLSSGWRLCTISAHVESASTDQVTLTVAGSDGQTGIEAICVVGAACYLIRAADVITLPIGSATVEKLYWAAGEVNAPVAVRMDPGSTGAHNFNILVEYVGSLS